MSSELFRGLEFVQVGAVACFCSLGAATLTELLFPAYDSRRNPVWQGMEGILGMLFHYLVGLEAFTLLCPLRYIAYPATVFAVFSPVMLPNTLAKMNNTMSGLASLVRPAATWTPPSPVGPPRPVPGSFQWDQALQKAKDGAARAVVDLRARIDSDVTDEVVEQVDALEAAMRSELGELYADYLASRDSKVKQAYDQLQAKWATTLASLQQSVAQARATLNAKRVQAESALNCVGAGMRKAISPGLAADGVKPFCVACPPGYSWQEKTGHADEKYQLATVYGGQVCKPESTGVPSDPVIPVDPGRPPLAKGTYAYTGDKNACRDTIAGYRPQYPSVDECGRQESCMETTNPVTGEKEATLCQCTPEGLTDVERDMLYSEPSRSEFISVVDPANPRKTKCARCRPVVQGGVSPVVHYTLPDGSTRTCGAG